MSKIKNYGLDSLLTGTDKLIGSDSDSSGTTKNYSINSISNYIYTDLDIGIIENKLAGIESGAQVNTVDSVNTQTGDVVLDADNINDTNTANKFTSQSDIDRLANTSGTNTGDQDISGISTNASDITDLQNNKLDKVAGIYGVEWNKTFPTTDCTRVGDMSLHDAVNGLPVHKEVKRCVMLDDGTVNYYLDPDDSTLRDDGTPSNLEGDDGQVMVEIPEHWRRFDEEGDIQRVLISTTPFLNAHRVPKIYVSAFEATVDRTNNKLSSVATLNTDYRGGNNNASLDGNANSQLGMPATSLSRINFTDYANNRGANWYANLYDAHLNLFWLYTIEYATKNSQKAFTNTLTPEGYRDGGLGAGVTNISIGSWGNFNGRYPFVKCFEESTNNFTNSIPYTHPVLGATQIPVYRGVEHPFGHIWKWTEQINVKAIDGQNLMYKANSFNFQSSNYQGYKFIGELAGSNGYIEELLFGDKGHILPVDTSGASSSTYWADFYFENAPPSGEAIKGLRFGGRADNGAPAGFVSSVVLNAPSITRTTVGSRLCFFEKC